MEYFIAAVAVAGFAYFIYSRVRASRSRKPSEFSGVGGRPRPGIKTQEK